MILDLCFITLFALSIQLLGPSPGHPPSRSSHSPVSASPTSHPSTTLPSHRAISFSVPHTNTPENAETIASEQREATNELRDGYIAISTSELEKTTFSYPKSPKPKGRKEKNETEFLGCCCDVGQKVGGREALPQSPPRNILNQNEERSLSSAPNYIKK